MKKEKPKKEKFRMSRWKYAVGYLLFLILVFFAIWFFDSGTEWLSYILTGLSIVLIIFLEIMIRSEVLILGEDHLIFRIGILSTRTKRVRYPDVLNTNVHQNLWQRIFNYGTLEVDTGGTSDIEIAAESIVKPFRAERIIHKKGTSRAVHYGGEAYQQRFAGGQQPARRSYPGR